MTDVKIQRGPNVINPEIPGAIGSRNSQFRDGRDEYAESKALVEDEVEKILNHVESKLPSEVLGQLEVMAGVKSKLYNYYNLNYQNMLNRYLVSVEDIMAQKYRDLIDKEEYKQLNQYNPRLISDLLRDLNDGEFNTAQIEKNFASTYVQLQKNIDSSIKKLSADTQVMLQQRTGAGSFLEASDASKLVQCSFKNNALKPQTVLDVKIAINVLDDELVEPIFHYQKPISDLLKDVISRHIHEKIEQQVASLISESRSNGEELSEEKELMKRFELLETYLGTQSNPADPKDKRYDYVAKKIMDAVDDGSYELPASEMEMGTIKANVKKVLDQAQVRNKGFNKAVNMLTTILDESKIGYQYIDNLKNARTCQIKEYQDIDPTELPDETFSISLTYLDWDQLRAKRAAYEAQAKELEAEVTKVVAVMEKLFQDYCNRHNILTYQDLADEFIASSNKLEGEARVWNELVFTDASRKLEKIQTFKDFTTSVKRKIGWCNSKLEEVYRNDFPSERQVIEERVEFLKNQFELFTGQVNPFHLQQGLVVQLAITTVKKKGTTLRSISQVMNQLLAGLSRRFKDPEVGSFTTKRQGVQSAIKQEALTLA